jgi:hypothetical protein
MCPVECGGHAAEWEGLPGACSLQPAACSMRQRHTAPWAGFGLRAICCSSVAPRTTVRLSHVIACGASEPVLAELINQRGHLVTSKHVARLYRESRQIVWLDQKGYFLKI